MPLDLENLPNPDQFKLADFPGVKSELVEEMVATGNSRYLIDLLSVFRRSQLRAEMLAKVYFDQMELYKRRLDEARGTLPRLNVEKTRERHAAVKKKQDETPHEGHPVGWKPPNPLALDL